MHDSQTTDSANINPASTWSRQTAVKLAVCLALLILIIGGRILWKADSE